MDNRLQHFFLTQPDLKKGCLKNLATPILTAAMTLGLSPAFADDTEASSPVQIIQPELDRREIKPVQIDHENFEVGAYYGIISIEDFDSSELIGIRAAYHISEDFFFEVTASDGAKGDLTSFEQLSGGSPLFTDEDREYSYYNLSIGWNILPGEVFILDKYAFNSALYIIAGAGSTEFAGDSWFTFTFGAGYRLLLTDWLAWHIDVRDHIFDRDSFGVEETTNNIEFHTGITFFF